MRMFIWSSKLLKEYGQGTIAVLAESVEEARKKVLDDYSPLEEGSAWKDDTICPYSEGFEDDCKKQLNMLKEDLSEEPTVSDILVIRGGE